VGVTRHEPHAAESAGDQAAQELRPEGAVLARPDVQPQHLTLAGGPHAHRDDHRHGHDAAVVADLHEGGVEPHVRVRPLQPATTEARHLAVEFGAQARDLALADALQPQRPHQLVHPPGRDPLHVRFTHHRHQGPLGPPARLQ
jgi:hypothetical protein